MIDQKLERYGKSEVYPFHMPGHKRISLGEFDPYRWDITEITGFDDLHDPHGDIQKLQEAWADAYGAKEAFLMVNGSTCGILTAIFSALQPEEGILIARNSHRSVYHGAYLRNAKVHYIYPEMIQTGAGYIAGEIRAEKLDEILSENPEIKAFLCTSPTYEGIVSDIYKLSEVTRAHGVTFIVDAAHGAHFGLDENSFANPITLGADLVITSLHKTLPAFTSTALLLKSKTCSILTEELMFYLDCFETSSPSYILMASVAKCFSYIKEKGKRGFLIYHKNLNQFYEDTNDLKNIKVLQLKNQDPGKILISGEGVYTGRRLFDILRDEYDLELEMAAGGYCLAMTSLMDTKEGFHRLSLALHEIDDASTVERKAKKIVVESEAPVYPKPICILSMSEAIEAKKVKRVLSSSANCISAGFVGFYPPGIPILAPGELITEEIQRAIKEGIRLGRNIKGMDEKGIFIVD